MSHQPRPPLNTDAVFCHECQHEWPRVEYGLTCPNCASEFTEIVEPDNDPRVQAVDEPPFGAHDFLDHDPWGTDPDEADIDEFTRTAHGPNGAMRFTTVTYRSGTPRTGSPHPNIPEESPIYEDFHRMMAGLVQPPQGTQNTGPPGQGTGNRTRIVFGTTTASSPLRPRDAAQPQPEVNPVGNLPEYAQPAFAINFTVGPGSPIDPSVLRALFEQLGAADHHTHGNPHEGPVPGVGADAPHGMPMNPFATIFSSFLNPAAASSGDAVYTQEALDRVITQLMETNTSSNAPGPASEEAISALPKKTITMADLGDEGKCECSVCMDDVPVGEKVTKLPCEHWFHDQCARMWLKEHDTCPICRKGIMSSGRPDGAAAATANQAPSPHSREFPSNPWRHPQGDRFDPWRPDPNEHLRRYHPNSSAAYGGTLSPEYRYAATHGLHARGAGNGNGQAESSASGGGTRPGPGPRHGSAQSGSDAGTGSASPGGGISDRVRGWFSGGGGGSAS